MDDKPSTPTQLERISFSTVKLAFMRILNLEKGVFYTLWALTAYPGKAIRNYLFEDRTKLSKPFGFLLLSVALAAFATAQLLDPEAMVQAQMEGKNYQNNEQLKAIMDLYQKIYFGYTNIIMLVTVPITSFFTHKIFKKPALNGAEHFVLNSYIFGYQSFIYLLLFPLMMYDVSFWNQIYLVVAILYSFYAYAKIFDHEVFESCMRSLLTTLLTYTAFFFFLFILIIGIAVSVLKG